MTPRITVAALGVLALVSLQGAAKACDHWIENCTGLYSAVQSRPIAHRSGRPAGCPGRSWCGCWLALDRYGRHVKRLWLARAWAREGRPAAGPAPGVIAVYARGRRAGHVGRITRVLGPGRIVLLSGNDGGRVRERERSTAGIIAYRRL